ncbi:hypothetical protein Fmac_033073 [Flemingia macrophylla]|uniref:Uncharacterized protein n=1 Tax=Flemingia macrophylla TaxID=520843 RepID=A0ABD1L6Q8_9FABA
MKTGAKTSENMAGAGLKEFRLLKRGARQRENGAENHGGKRLGKLLWKVEKVGKSRKSRVGS